MSLTPLQAEISARWPWQKEVFLHLQYTPWIKLPRRWDTSGALAEALRYEKDFVVHRPYQQSIEKEGKWKSLALKSVGGDAGNTSGLGETYEFSTFAELCPETFALLSQITDPMQCARIRFMMMEPESEIMVHCDAPGKAASLSINIALNMPAGCEFWVDLSEDGSVNAYSHRVPVEAGEAILFNTACYHRVVNNSDERRVHLIAHGPLKFSDRELIESARSHHGGGEGLRQLTNMVVRKRIRLQKILAEDPVLEADFFNLGEHPQVLWEDISVAVLDDLGVTETLHREARLATAASLLSTEFESVNLGTIDSWLHRSADAGKEWALVMAAGTFVPQPIIFFVEVVAEATRLLREKFSLAGHIIRRAERLPRLHEQFFLLHLPSWRSAGSPAVSGGARDFPAYDVSDQCIHDDYTPLWLRKGEGEVIRGSPGFGTNLLAGLIRAGYAVSNVSLSLRALKDFMYPDEGPGENYRRVKAKVESAQRGSRVFVFNTEPLKVEDFGFRPDVLIAPCSGLKPFALLRQFGLQAGGARLILADVNPEAVEYFRNLFRCETKPEIITLLTRTLGSHGLVPAEGERYIKRMLDAALEEGFGGRCSDLLDCVRSYRDRAVFCSLNYLSEASRIRDFISPQEKVLFWHSNAWEFPLAYFNLEKVDARANYLCLINNLREYFALPAFVHREAFKGVLGNEFHVPQVVLTQGGSKLGTPKRGAYERV